MNVFQSLMMLEVCSTVRVNSPMGGITHNGTKHGKKHTKKFQHDSTIALVPQSFERKQKPLISRPFSDYVRLIVKSVLTKTSE